MADDCTFIQAGSGAVTRSCQDKMRDWLSVRDFGATGDGITDDVTAFAAAIAASDNQGKALFVPAGQYSLHGSLNWPAGLTIFGEGRGSCLNFVDGGLEASDVDYICGRDFVVSRTGLTGPAIKFSDGGTGFRRNYLDNVGVSGSSGNGVEISSGWLFTWVNPYVHNCLIGLLIEIGGVATTGLNSASLIGGEFQANSVAGVVLDTCKQFNMVGTCIEGCGIGLGIGRNCSSMSVLGYFESNSGGHIAPYANNGGASGIAASLVIQGGTNFTRGTAGSSPAISVTGCRQFIVEDGVRFGGYALQTSPLIEVAEAGDTNPAVGYIGQIYTDSAPGLTIQNDCRQFGRLERLDYAPGSALAADAITTVRLPVQPLSTLTNPAAYLKVYISVDSPSAGGAAFAVRVRDAAGNLVGAQANVTPMLAAGFNQFVVNLQDSDSVVALELVRSGTSAGDTAPSFTLLGVTLERHTNRVKNI